MLGSTTLLMLALAAPPKLGKIEVPKAEAPKLDWGKQDPLKADGLTRPEQEQQLETRKAATEVARPGGASASVEKVVHAREFVGSGEARKPKGPIDAFAVAGFPARIERFKSLLRLSSKDRSPVILRVSVRSPAGDELLSSRGEASFDAGEQVDFVIDWDGFEARAPGDYKFVVTIDGETREFALPVRGK
ncbi:MAG: DUF6941 family protein [Myxococcales bacterium]